MDNSMPDEHLLLQHDQASEYNNHSQLHSQTIQIPNGFFYPSAGIMRHVSEGSKNRQFTRQMKESGAKEATSSHGLEEFEDKSEIDRVRSNCYNGQQSDCVPKSDAFCGNQMAVSEGTDSKLKRCQDETAYCIYDNSQQRIRRQINQTDDDSSRINCLVHEEFENTNHQIIDRLWIMRPPEFYSQPPQALFKTVSIQEKLPFVSYVQPDFMPNADAYHQSQSYTNSRKECDDFHRPHHMPSFPQWIPQAKAEGMISFDYDTSYKDDSFQQHITHGNLDHTMLEMMKGKEYVYQSSFSGSKQEYYNSYNGNIQGQFVGCMCNNNNNGLGNKPEECEYHHHVPVNYSQDEIIGGSAIDYEYEQNCDRHGHAHLYSANSFSPKRILANSAANLPLTATEFIEASAVGTHRNGSPLINQIEMYYYDYSNKYSNLPIASIDQHRFTQNQGNVEAEQQSAQSLAQNIQSSNESDATSQEQNVSDRCDLENAPYEGLKLPSQTSEKINSSSLLKNGASESQDKAALKQKRIKKNSKTIPRIAAATKLQQKKKNNSIKLIEQKSNPSVVLSDIFSDQEDKCVLTRRNTVTSQTASTFCIAYDLAREQEEAVAAILQQNSKDPKSNHRNTSYADEVEVDEQQQLQLQDEGEGEEEDGNDDYDLNKDDDEYGNEDDDDSYSVTEKYKRKQKKTKRHGSAKQSGLIKRLKTKRLTSLAKDGDFAGIDCNSKNKFDTKNLVKNFLNQFLSFVHSSDEETKIREMLDFTAKGELIDYQEKLKLFFKGKKFNRSLLKDFIQIVSYRTLFRYFLEHRANEWIAFGRMKDKPSHFRALQNFQYICENHNEIKSWRFRYNFV